MKTENNINTQNSSLISENVKYDSSIIDLLYEFDFKNYNRYGSLKGVLYEIKAYLDTNDVIQENMANKLDDNVKHLDFIDKKVDFLSPICKAMDRLEDKIDSITSKITPNTSEVKDYKNGTGKILEVLLHENTTIKRKLEELENKVKNIKEDKRSLFGRIFGE